MRSTPAWRPSTANPWRRLCKWICGSFASVTILRKRFAKASGSCGSPGRVLIGKNKREACYRGGYVAKANRMAHKRKGCGLRGGLFRIGFRNRTISAAGLGRGSGPGFVQGRRRRRLHCRYNVCRRTLPNFPRAGSTRTCQSTASFCAQGIGCSRARPQLFARAKRIYKSTCSRSSSLEKRNGVHN